MPDSTISSVCGVLLVGDMDLPTLVRYVAEVHPQVHRLLILSYGRDRSWGLPLPPNTRILREQSGIPLGEVCNKGVQYAAARRYEYILWLELSERPLGGTVARLGSLAEGMRDANIPLARVGAESSLSEGGKERPRARARKGFLGLFRRRCRSGREFEATDVLPLCCSLVPLDRYRDVGPFDARLDGDAVEIEWSFRAAKKGFIDYLVCGTRTLRASRPVHGEPQDRVARSAASYRRARDRFLLYRHPNIPWSWVLRDFSRGFLLTLLVSPLAPLYFRRAWWSFRGMLDGLRGRPPAPPRKKQGKPARPYK